MRRSVQAPLGVTPPGRRDASQCCDGFLASAGGGSLLLSQLGSDRRYVANQPRWRRCREAAAPPESIDEQIGYLEKSSSPIDGIENMLLAFATRVERDGIVGCMGVNAICEFGRSDRGVTSLGRVTR